LPRIGWANRNFLTLLSQILESENNRARRKVRFKKDAPGNEASSLCADLNDLHWVRQIWKSLYENRWN
jgi:hypothetical protein